MNNNILRRLGRLLLSYGIALLTFAMAIDRLVAIHFPKASSIIYIFAAMIFSSVCCLSLFLIVQPRKQVPVFLTAVATIPVFVGSFAFSLFWPYFFPAVIGKIWFIVGFPLFVSVAAFVSLCSPTWGLWSTAKASAANDAPPQKGPPASENCT